MDFEQLMQRRKWSVKVITDLVTYYETFDLPKIKARLEDLRKENLNPKAIPVSHLLVDIGIDMVNKAAGRRGKTVKSVEVTEESDK